MSDNPTHQIRVSNLGGAIQMKLDEFKNYLESQRRQGEFKKWEHLPYVEFFDWRDSSKKVEFRLKEDLKPGKIEAGKGKNRVLLANILEND